MIKDSVVILANGDFPSHPIPHGILKDAQIIICCDGAVNHLVQNGMEPHYILGDMDSIDDDLKNKYKNKIFKLSDQSENDLRKTIEWIENNGASKATLIGATGKREDHSIANIFTLLQYPTQLEIVLYTDFGIFSVVKDQHIFESFIGQNVSIFSADPKIKITSNNLKYNLNNKSLTNLYYGSLNESIDDTFMITLSHGEILVYQTFA